MSKANKYALGQGECPEPCELDDARASVMPSGHLMLGDLRNGERVELLERSDAMKLARWIFEMYGEDK